MSTSASRKLIEELGIKNIINYLRKSRQDEEREKKTGEDVLHEQKVLMDRVLSGYGVPYDQKSEVGSGDKISSRPVFQGILSDLRNEKYQAIAVKEISRMGRGSYTDMGTIFDLITEKRIYIITPYKIYDPTNPSDLRQIRFELFLSREEFESTRERLTGGRYNAAMEGKWVAGAAPFGYKYNPYTKRLEPYEEEAQVIRAIFDFYVNGIVVNGKRKQVSFRALASYLTRLGLKTARGKTNWHPKVVQDLLSNNRYIGNIRFRTTQRTADGKQIPRPEDEHIIVEDAHPPIIDLDTWEKAQAKMEGRETVPRSKLDFDPCELAGLCVCNVCGRRMVRQYSTQHYKKKDGTTTVYHKEFLWCTTPGCTFVKYRNIEEDLIGLLSYLTELDDNTFLNVLEPMITKKTSLPSNEEEMAKHVEMRHESLKRRLKFVYEKYESGIYSDQEFVERREEIEKEIASLEKITLKTDEPVVTQDSMDPSTIRGNIKTVLEEYNLANHKSDRNIILRSVFDKVTVKIIEKGRGRKQAKHMIYPEIKVGLLSSSFLV